MPLLKGRPNRKQMIASALSIARKKRADGGGVRPRRADGGDTPSFPDMVAQNPRGWGTAPPPMPDEGSISLPPGQADRRAQFMDTFGTDPDLPSGQFAGETAKNFARQAAPMIAAEVAGPAVGGFSLAAKYAPRATAAGMGALGYLTTPSGASDTPPLNADVKGAPVQSQLQDAVAEMKRIGDLRDKAQAELEFQRDGGTKNGRTALAGRGHDYANAQAQIDQYNKQYGEAAENVNALRRRSDPDYMASIDKMAHAEQVRRDTIANARQPWEQAQPWLADHYWALPMAAGALGATALRVPPAISAIKQASRWRQAVGMAQDASATPAERDVARRAIEQFDTAMPKKSWGDVGKSYIGPTVAGFGLGAASANVPAYHDFRLPEENPEYTAYQQYIKELPAGAVGDPERQKATAILQSTQQRNPAQKAGEEYFTKGWPVGVGTIEGGLQGAFGADVATTASKALGPFESGLPRPETKALLAKYGTQNKRPPGSGGSGGPPPPAGGPGPGPSPSLGALVNPGASRGATRLEPDLPWPPPPKSAGDATSASTSKAGPVPPPLDMAPTGQKPPPAPPPASSSPAPAPENLKPVKGASGKTWHHPDTGNFVPAPVKTKRSANKAQAQPKPKAAAQDDVPLDKNGIPIKPDRIPDPDKDPGNFQKGGGVFSHAMSLARKYAKGGAVVGALVGNTGGRADKLSTSVPPGSHVVPADVVSHFGEGNTLRGLDVMKKMFGVSGNSARASGGSVPVYLSDGEFVVPPEAVAARGGHDAIDKFILQSRQDHINTLANLPPPAR